jgi:hypothetical protein
MTWTELWEKMKIRRWHWRDAASFWHDEYREHAVTSRKKDTRPRKIPTADPSKGGIDSYQKIMHDTTQVTVFKMPCFSFICP